MQLQILEEERGNISLPFLWLYARFADKYEISGIGYGKILKQLQRAYQGQVKHSQRVFRHSHNSWWRMLSILQAVFLSLARFWCTWERLCMNRVRSLLSMCCMLLGYSLNPGLIALNLVQRAQLWSSVCQWKDACTWRPSLRLTSPEVRAAATSKLDVIQAEPPFHLLT